MIEKAEDGIVIVTHKKGETHSIDTRSGIANAAEKLEKLLGKDLEAAKAAYAEAVVFIAAAIDNFAETVKQQPEKLEDMTADDLKQLQDYCQQMQEIEARKPENAYKSIPQQSLQEYLLGIDSQLDALFEWRSERLGIVKECAEFFFEREIFVPLKEEKETKKPKVTPKSADKLDYPVDKVNSFVWKLLEHDTAGQLVFATEKHGSGREANVLYSIDLEGLSEEESVKISKQLTPYDKRVYIAIGGLFNAGNEYVSTSQIYHAMGGTGTPARKHLDGIRDAVTKMRKAEIIVDNSQEVDAGYKYPKFKYSGSLLPNEWAEAEMNGTEATVIHLFREPPLITFARKRKQITTVKLAVLQSPINKTEANLQLEDYLLERISREKAKKDAKQARLLLGTIYEKAGITTKKQKQRAPEKIKKYLDHYCKTGFIDHYSMDKDGVTVYF